MALVTSKTKAMHDQKHMNKMAGKPQEKYKGNPAQDSIVASGGGTPAEKGIHAAKQEAEQSSSGKLADQAYALSAQKFPSGDAMKAHAVAAESYLKEGQHELATRHRELSHSHFLGLAKQNQSDDGEFHVYHKETNKHQGTYKSNKEASSFKNKLNENKPGEYHIITTPKND